MSFVEDAAGAARKNTKGLPRQRRASSRGPVPTDRIGVYLADRLAWAAANAADADPSEIGRFCEAVTTGAGHPGDPIRQDLRAVAIPAGLHAVRFASPENSGVIHVVEHGSDAINAFDVLLAIGTARPSWALGTLSFVPAGITLPGVLDAHVSFVD